MTPLYLINVNKILKVCLFVLFWSSSAFNFCVHVLDLRETYLSHLREVTRDRKLSYPKDIPIKIMAFYCDGCNEDTEPPYPHKFGGFAYNELLPICCYQTVLRAHACTHVTVSTVNINKLCDDSKSAVWGSVRTPHLLFFHTAQGHMRCASLKISSWSSYQHMSAASPTTIQACHL